MYKCIKELPSLTKENNRLKEIDSRLLRTSIFDLDNAYQKQRKTKEHSNSKVNIRVDKYYVSLYVEEVITPLSIPASIVGIDVEIKELVVTSNGKIYEKQKQIKKYEEKIKDL